MKNKKLKIALIFNLIVLCLEIISFTVMGKFKLEHLKFYTVLSNILCMITSAIYVAVYFIKREKITSKWINYLKFVTTVNLVITFSVCLLILGPTKEVTYKWLFLNYPNIFHHLLCPILTTISFLFFENGYFSKKNAYPFTHSNSCLCRSHYVACRIKTCFSTILFCWRNLK